LWQSLSDKLSTQQKATSIHISNRFLSFSFILVFRVFGKGSRKLLTIPEMAPKQRMRIANEKASKNITMRGQVAKSSVSFPANNFQKHMEFSNLLSFNNVLAV